MSTLSASSDAKAQPQPDGTVIMMQTVEICVRRVDSKYLKYPDQPEASTQEENGRRMLRPLMINQDPQILIIPDFLTSEEADHLVASAEAHWKPSLVYGSATDLGAGGASNAKVEMSGDRTSHSAILEASKSGVPDLEHRLAGIAGIDVQYLEQLNLVRYRPGERFREHHDGRHRPKTVFIYLNDLPDDDGGETLFPRLGLTFVPRKGTAVMWPNTTSFEKEDYRVVHQGLPPKTAIKYGVNCFFNDKPRSECTLEMPDSHRTPLPTAASMTTIDPNTLVASDPAKAAENKAKGILQPLLVLQDPQVLVVPNVFNDEEIQHLLSLAEGKWEEATVLRPDGQLGPSPDRTSKIHNLQPAQTDMVFSLEQRVAGLIGLEVERMEPFNMVKYEPGEYFKVHHDGKVRTMTVLVYLNDVLEGDGGETSFPTLGLQFRPRKGTAVIWPNCVAPEQEDLRVVHEGKPPNVLKHAVNCFVSQGYIRKPGGKSLITPP
mmetsp:Transcript_12268/g.27845  ORF Transcript_12268/g.27845 Transcript_12268/m.27845 type:complete len:490 (-) Transcript_12268:60-1529(-)